MAAYRDPPDPHLVERHPEAVCEGFCLEVGTRVGRPDLKVARIVELGDDGKRLPLKVRVVAGP